MTVTLALVAALCIAQSGLAEPRPNLSGRWVPADSKLADYELQIRHEGNSLTIETPVFRVRGSTNTPMTSTRVGLRQERFLLDGSEVLHGIVGQVTPQSTSRPPGEESVTRAAWAGNRVVILTHTTITAPSLSEALPHASGPSAVSSRRQTTWQAYSIDGDGQLVVERLITVDPSPSSYAKHPPVVTQVIYKKM